MHRYLLAVAFVALALGAITATGAFTGGDGAVSDVYLNPAPTVEGAEYASFDGSGTLQVEITGMNENALTEVRTVFNVTATTSTQVWIEHDGTGVSLYRSDTGGSIEGTGNAVQLGADQSVPVGVRVDTRSSAASVSTMEVHATVDQSSESSDYTPPTPSTPGTPPTPSTTTPDNGSSTPVTTTGPAPPADGSGPTPGNETATAPGTEPSDDGIEIAGFPLWIVALVTIALALLGGGLALWRYRAGGPGATIRLTAGSDLALAPGSLGDGLDATVRDDGSAVRLSGERFEADGTTDAIGTIAGAVTITNTSDTSAAVSARLASDTEGVSLLIEGGGRTDILGNAYELAPGESRGMTLVLGEGGSNQSFDIVIGTS